jgi:lipopolysaccharide/colanic/teichoic acid biosynthesis glycosyltransferase
MKRAFDVSAASIGLTILSPVIAAISLASLAHFRANPFYLAHRIGKDGKPFSMLKFRSMDDSIDDSGNFLPDEKRATPYGHFLRATALDELPQLINILKGDMSFVGPRPRDPESVETDKVPDDYKDIFSVRPGLTGPWQVAAIGRETAFPPEERLRLDASYARNNPTLTKDIVLMLKTIPALLRGHDGESLRKPAAKSGDPSP